MSSNLKIENPYKNDGSYDFIPPHRLIGPGPCNCSPAVLNALVNQAVTVFGNPHFYKLMEDLKKMTRYVFQTKNELTLIGQYSGNGGNETMVVNLADPGETIIVATTGVWGVKVADFGRRYNLNVVELTIPFGEVYTLEELEKQIIKHKPVALFVTHGESSTGTLQPLEGMGAMCHKYNCLLAVDAIISLGVAPVLTDEWEIDAIDGGTQKGIGAPAGMCLLSFSDRAYKKVLSKKHRTPYIFDLLMLGDMWGCYGRPRRYIYSFSTQMLMCVKQALIEICEEGLEKVWQRHEDTTKYFLMKAEKLGMKNIVERKENVFYGTVCMSLPKDIKWPLLLEYTLNKYNLEFGIGIGPTGGRSLRIGFLAQNAKKEIVDHFIKVLEDGFQHLRSNKLDPNKCSVTLIFKQWLNNFTGESFEFDDE